MEYDERFNASMGYIREANQEVINLGYTEEEIAALDNLANDDSSQSRRKRSGFDLSDVLARKLDDLGANSTGVGNGTGTDWLEELEGARRQGRLASRCNIVTSKGNYVWYLE